MQTPPLARRRLLFKGWGDGGRRVPTEIYADYAPDPTQGAAWAARAFGESAQLTVGESAVRRANLME